MEHVLRAVASPFAQGLTFKPKQPVNTRRLITLACGLVLAALLIDGCALLREGPQEAGPPPEPVREFRAAWIASVANIDWPSEPGLPVAEQQAELRAMLDRAAALHLNAVILQVRPAADALYDSPYEPWSEYLTGTQGQAPEPYYDPLRFALEEAHARGLDLHVWFNPFRAGHPSAVSDYARGHVSQAHPEWVRRYGDYLWLDPGEPAAREHSLRVMLDVVRRYDVDGVHLDDYFYPYPIADSTGRDVPFPDSASWARASSDARLDRDDWRRSNIDRFVEALYQRVKAEKPHVLVGISPFGIWRPGHPPSITGFDPYAKLYADARKWLVEGWVDYWTPQLYWPIDQEGQRYPVLLAWWAEQNVRDRHLWPGNYTSRVAAGEHPWPVGELVEQIRLTRRQPGATGNVHFSMIALMQERNGLAETLAEGVYARPALVPQTPWIEAEAPPAPSVAVRPPATLVLTPGGNGAVHRWVVRVRHGAAWSLDVLPGAVREHTLEHGRPDEVVVSAVGRLGRESAPVRWPGGRAASDARSSW